MSAADTARRAIAVATLAGLVVNPNTSIRSALIPWVKFLDSPAYGMARSSARTTLTPRVDRIHDAEWPDCMKGRTAAHS